MAAVRGEAQAMSFMLSSRVALRSSRLRTRLALIGAIVLVAAACSSAASPAGPRLATGGGEVDTSGHAVGAPDYPSAAASAAPAPAAVDGTNSGPQNGGPQDVIPNESFIVKTGSMTVEVPAIDAALLKARAAIVGLGGYISGSDQADQGDQMLASVTYRIPAARWEDALDAIRVLATKVVAVKTGTEEVTGQVLDLGARIDNLRATEQALQAIMVKAIKIQDILDVQNQLTGVRGQIEQLTTEQSHLRDQAALSTLTVVFQTPIVPAVKETSKGWDPATEFDRAVSQLLGLGQGVATVGIWFVVVALPLLVVLGFVLGFMALVLRRFGWRPTRPSGPSAPSAPSGPPSAGASQASGSESPSSSGIVEARSET
jgi:hypothetical protein